MPLNDIPEPMAVEIPGPMLVSSQRYVLRESISVDIFKRLHLDYINLGVLVFSRARRKHGTPASDASEALVEQAIQPYAEHVSRILLDHVLGGG